MPGITNNIYGKIKITDKTIKRFIYHVAMDCYGMMGFAHKNTFDFICGLFKDSSATKGVKVHSLGDRIYIELSVILKYGASIKAVVEALKESVKYKVERFTGMLVDTININVMGVKN